MKDREFSSGIQAVRQHAEELRARADQPLSDSSILLEALEHLQVSLEELQVAQEELRQQNEELAAAGEIIERERLRYRELFEFAPDAYLVTNAHGIIMEANRAAIHLLQVPDRFLPGKPLPTFIAEEDRQAFRQNLSKLLQSDNRREMELRLAPRGGSPVDVSIHAAAVRGRDGGVDAIHWMVRDISDQKRAAAEIVRLNEDLEERVRQRTAQLEMANRAKDELLMAAQRAREEAEAANHSKDEFLAIISHELRTPLNAILGWLQLVRKQMNDPEMVAHTFDVIERNARTQAQLISELLDISRVVTGNLQLEPEQVELAAALEKAVDAVRPAAEQKGIHLELRVEDSEALVWGDPNRLQQVIWNLLSNGIKFTDPGGRVEARLTSDGKQAQVTVSDTGQGIRAEFLPYVFDRFRQAESSSRRTYGGLGLGLSIVRSLVEMHGGSVRAESAGEGAGASFTIKLPLLKQTQPRLIEMENTAAAPNFAELTGRKLTDTCVLVVDDEADARQLLKVVLENAGARVLTAASCAEALNILRRDEGADRPDILISDIGMPGEDGYDLIRQVRQSGIQGGAYIPAIALTAYAGKEDRQRILAAGYQTHVAKPVALQELLLVVAGFARPA